MSGGETRETHHETAQAAGQQDTRPALVWDCLAATKPLHLRSLAAVLSLPGWWGATAESPREGPRRLYKGLEWLLAGEAAMNGLWGYEWAWK